MGLCIAVCIGVYLLRNCGVGSLLDCFTDGRQRSLGRAFLEWVCFHSAAFLGSQ